MKANYRKIPTRFEPETRFEILPVKTTPFRLEVEDPLEALKGRMLANRLDDVWDPEFNSLVRRAANEAAAVAWATPYPVLVFPVLFEEMISAGAARAARQSTILARSRELLAA